MTAKRCKAVSLSSMVSSLIIEGMRDKVSLSTYKEAMDYKPVLAIHLLIVLVTRHRALIEDARSGRILDLHCRHDGRRHRHDVSHGRL